MSWARGSAGAPAAGCSRLLGLLSPEEAGCPGQAVAASELGTLQAQPRGQDASRPLEELQYTVPGKGFEDYSRVSLLQSLGKDHSDLDTDRVLIIVQRSRRCCATTRGKSLYVLLRMGSRGDAALSSFATLFRDISGSSSSVLMIWSRGLMRSADGSSVPFA